MKMKEIKRNFKMPKLLVRSKRKRKEEIREARFQLMAKSRYFVDRKSVQGGADWETASADGESKLLQNFVDLLDCDENAMGKVLNICGSLSEFGDKVTAVLAAVEMAINNAGGNAGVLEHFAALSTMLSTVGDDMLTASSVLFLMKVLMPQLPRTVLINRFSLLSELMYSALTRFLNLGQDVVVRNAVVCLGLLLKAQPERVWQCSSTGCMFDCILMLVNYENPLVRRAARKATSTILNAWDKDGLHPAADRCFLFCNSALQKTDGDEQQRRLNILQLLLHVLTGFSHQHVRTICKMLLLFMSEGHAETAALCMSVLDSMFRSRPGEQSLTRQLNLELVRALYDCKPIETSEVLMVAWINAVTESHACLWHKDEAEGKAYALRWLSLLVPLLGCGHDGTIRVTAGATSRVIRICFDSTDAAVFAPKILSILLTTLRPVEYPALKQLQRMFDTFFSVFRRSLAKEDLKECMQVLADLQETNTNKRICAFARRVIGSAVRYVGPDFVLDILPLRLENATPGLPCDLSRMWLLSVLRRHVQETQFDYFVSTIVPLAFRYKQYAEAAVATEGKDSGYVFRKVYTQLWALLPSFCRRPVDLGSNDALIGSVLACALLEEPESIDFILTALRTLANCSSRKKEAMHVVAGVLPTLCRVYISQEWPKATRLTMLATVRTISGQMPKEAFSDYVEPGLETLKQLAPIGGDEFNRLADLLAIYAGLVDTDCSNDMLLTILLLKDVDDRRQLKKLYRILEMLLHNELTVISTENLDALLQWLRRRPGQLPLSARAAVYGCLAGLVKRFPPELTATAKELLTEAFSVDIKNSNAKVKKRCASLLFAVVDLLQSQEDEGVEKALQEAYHCVTCFLPTQDVGQSIGAVLGFRFMLYHYREAVSYYLAGDMLQRVEPMMAMDNFSVVKAALQFYLTFVTALPQKMVWQYLGDVVPALFKQAEGCSRRSRFRTRALLVKLVRLFSYEVVVKFVPERERVRLAYVRRMVARRFERSAASMKEPVSDGSKSVRTLVDTMHGLLGANDDQLCDSDSESVKSLTIVSGVTRGGRSVKSGKPDLRFLENEDEEVVDLLDPDLHKHMVYEKECERRMNSGRVEEEDSDFEIAEDGRIIIVEPDKRSKKMGSGSDEQSSSDEEKSTAEVDSVQRRPPLPPRGVKKANKQAKVNLSRRHQKKFEPYAYIPLDYRKLKRVPGKPSDFKNFVGKRRAHK